MTIAVKYCGGCNPRYDRMALAARLEEDFPQITLASAGAQKPDFVLVLCGCPNCCASHHNLYGRLGKMVLDSPDGYPLLREALNKEFNKWIGNQYTGSG